MKFFSGGWLRRPGGQGGFRPPPYAPLDPLYPLQTAEGYPPDPPCTGKGTFPCLLDRQGPYRARTFSLALGPATNRVPGRARTLHGPDAGAHAAASGVPAVTAPCLHSKDNPAPANAGGAGSAAPKATVALPGTDVNPAGRAPARLAVHCILATGGPGAAMFHAPFGRPRRPLGTFPRGESTSSARRRTKPPTRNRFLVGWQ